jgi:hypothetical protein
MFIKSLENFHLTFTNVYQTFIKRVHNTDKTFRRRCQLSDQIRTGDVSPLGYTRLQRFISRGKLLLSFQNSVRFGLWLLRAFITINIREVEQSTYLFLEDEESFGRQSFFLIYHSLLPLFCSTHFLLYNILLMNKVERVAFKNS